LSKRGVWCAPVRKVRGTPNVAVARSRLYSFSAEIATQNGAAAVVLVET
jgi:hypothetical protein